MSAYIVSRNHILFLVCAAMSGRISPPNYGGFSYYHDGQRHRLDSGDFDAAADLANMLWRENIKSVSHRYPHESSATLPGPIVEDFDITAADISKAHRLVYFTCNPVHVFKAIDGYSYQTCEHPEWPTSAAHEFCDTLRKAACRALPGYEDAEWEINSLPATA